MSEEFHEGDLVEAVKGSGRSLTRFYGELRSTNWENGFTVQADGYEPEIAWLRERGFTVTVIEKAAPPLPTEAGLYRSSRADGIWVFSLDRAGDWTLLNTNSLFPIGDGHLEQNAPFTRLEPVPVIAKKVLDALRGRIGSIDSAYDFQAVAAQFGVTAQ